MQALQGTIVQYRLPKQPFADLLSAFLQDQSQFRYDSTDDLINYCPLGQSGWALVLDWLGPPMMRRTCVERFDMHRVCNWPTFAKTCIAMLG